MRLAERRSRRRSALRSGRGYGVSSSNGSLPEIRLSCHLAGGGGRLCAKCCYETEMPLTSDDIARLEAAGYKRREFMYIDEEGIPRLRNVNGHCVFLDEATGRCRVYGIRPAGCRLYPLVYDPIAREVVVDPDCPLTGLVPREKVARLAPAVKRLVEEIYGSRRRRNR